MKRFEIWIATLNENPQGTEMHKNRPVVIISPAQMNRRSTMVIIAPFTSTVKNYPTRVPTNFENQGGEIALDHMRSIDKTRMIKKIGTLDEGEAKDVCFMLTLMFEYKG